MANVSNRFIRKLSSNSTYREVIIGPSKRNRSLTSMLLDEQNRRKRKRAFLNESRPKIEAKEFNTLEENLQSLLDSAYDYLKVAYPDYDLGRIKTWDDSFAIPYGDDDTSIVEDELLKFLNEKLARMTNTDVVNGEERELIIDDEGEQIYVAIWR